MTTESATALGQRRFYTYEPMTLNPQIVWKCLSHCQFAATQALREIRVTWHREHNDTLIMAFCNPQGEAYQADWTVIGADPTAFDENKPASIIRYMRSRPEWRTHGSIQRVSDQHTMGDEDVFGTTDGRSVTVGDIWAALQTLQLSVRAHSERIRNLFDPPKPLFRDIEDAAVEPHPEQPTLIVAERRMLAYEDYLLDLRNIYDLSTSKEKMALICMADLRISWDDYGVQSAYITFTGPDERGYEAEVERNPAGDTASGICWDVEIDSKATGKQMKRNEVYYSSSGETVIFDDVMGVLSGLHDYLMQCEAQGYPALDQQTI